MAGITGGFIVNWIDQSQKTSLFRIIDAGLAIGWETDLCLSFLMTFIAGLCLFIDHCSDLGLIRGDSNFALFIENSYLDNALSLGHVINDSLIFVSSIFDHGIANAQSDGFAEVKGFLFSFEANLPGERKDIQGEEDPFNHHDGNDDTEKNLSL
jgi:hypothetical protein